MVVSQYDPELVTEAIRITGLVTIAMMCLGTPSPPFSKNFRRTHDCFGARHRRRTD